MIDRTATHAGDQAETEPLRLFSRSHAAILIHLEELRALPTRLAEPAPERRRAARESAATLLAFFRESVVEHHREEEQALFPAVARSAEPGDEASRVVAMAERLTSEHLRIDADWKAIEPAMVKIARGRYAELDRGIVSRLCDMYSAHAQFEETVYLPLAASILGADGLAALALTLHGRHSVDRLPGY